MAPPRVSVVVPTRNRAAYLRVALESLAAQDLDEPWEVIVVDDASGDSTGAVAERAGVAYLREPVPRAAVTGRVGAARPTPISSR